MTDKELDAVKQAVSALSSLLNQEHERAVVANGIGSRLVRAGKQTEAQSPKPVAQATPTGTLNIAQEDLDRLYSYCERRFIEACHTDPSLLALALAQSSILEVTMAPPRRISVDGTTARGRIARMLHDGWFDVQRSAGGTRTELARTGADVNGSNLKVILDDMKRDGFLVEEQNKYQKSTTMRVVLNKHVEAL